MKMNKCRTAIFAAMLLALGGFGLVFAHVIPGVDEPYDPPAYYSLTAISWADSPSPFALRDLANNGGNVYDYTRHIKSKLFGEDFTNILAIATSMTKNDIINTTPFTGDVFGETNNVLSLLRKGTEKTAKTINISESNPHLRQGDNDEWDAYNEKAYDTQKKYQWLDETYRQIAKGSKQELTSMRDTLTAADTVLGHTGKAEGELQLIQAQNELKALLAYEFARQNALEGNIAQLYAAYQANQYDETAESAFIDAITQMDIADPYDRKDYALLKETMDYNKPQVPGMLDFE